MASTFTDRLRRAALLDAEIYEEVEADETATSQAMAVVVLASVAAGLGELARSGIAGLLLGALVALIAWFIWAGITYFVGAKLLPESETEADLGQLLRTIGFSTAPGLLRVVGLIPWVGALLSLAIEVWMLMAMVVAVRQALDYRSTARAVLVCAVGFVVYLALIIPVRLAAWVGMMLL